ncbi:MAG: gyrase subunit [Clostridiales bacterium]|nr:gyrase subunit [Clostridiales bacterium]
MTMSKDTLYVEQPITEILEKNYMPYAMSVIVSRAIPEIDGFKPSHRKILYTMYKMKLLNGNRTKSANVVGQTMKLNPHGDQAIYATLVRLTKGNEALLLPYIDSKGNFGKVTSRDMKFAAARYTEVKLDKVCETIFADIDKDNVDFSENYDGSMLEPDLLPTTFPNILANPNKGIAVGMASNFPSFNLNELCEATIAYLQHNDVDLLEIMPAPDFPTAGTLIYTKADMRKIYETGVGSFKLRGIVNYDKKLNMLIITEIPYTTTVEQIIDKVIELIKAGRVKEVSDIRDETDLEGLKIALDLKRGTDPEALIAKLYKYTPLEDSFACNLNLLINGRPQVLGIKSILKEWVIFRQNCIRRSARFDINRLSEKLHLLKGLQSVLLDIDEAIKIIRETELEKEVIPRLMAHFSIDQEQAEYVADIRLRFLNREYILKRLDEIASLEKEIAALQMLVEDDRKINKQIIRDLKEIQKQYGKPRMTQLVHPEEIVIHEEEVIIEDYNLKVFLSAHQYLKKVSLVSLRSSGDHKLKEDDEIIQEIEGNNKDEILFFTDQCNVYKMKLHEIEDQKVSTLGIFLPNLLDMDENETVIYAVVTQSFQGHMIFGFENGKVAKVPLEAYQTKTNRKKLVKAYSDEAAIVGIAYLPEAQDIVAIREAGKGEVRAVVFNSDLVPEKVTKNTKGVQTMRMKSGAVMTYFAVLSEEDREQFSPYIITDIPKSGTILEPLHRMTLSSLLK